jgi:hypothetical protein
MWAQRRRHTLWWRWAPVRAPDGKRNPERGFRVGHKTAWAAKREGWQLPRSQNIGRDREPPAMTFF